MLLRKKYLIIGLIGISILAGCSKDEPSKTEESTNVLQVVTLSHESIKEIGLQSETVSSKPFIETITVSAKVVADQDNEALVGSMLKGRVHSMLSKVGDFVKAGQILMYVEGLEIGVIKSNYMKAKAQLDFNKADFERHKTLFEQNVGSKQSFYEAQAEYEKAVAEFKAEDKKIHSIGLTDEEVINNKNNYADEHTSGTLPVRSPISGIVVERNVVIGQFVDEATNAFKIINTSSVWIDGQIYEKDISKVIQKTGATFMTGSYHNEKFSGKIIYIGQVIDTQTRTITVRADFNNTNGKLKPQMFGELQIPVGENSNAILIPAESVIKIDNINYVFVQKNDSTFEKRSVIVGSSKDELLEIKNGIKENEKVVVKGAFYLKSELLKDELGAEE